MPEFQLVKYKVGKQHFELLVKPETVAKYREGKLGYDNVLFSDEIFKDHAKGDRAKASELASAFGTENVTDCIKVMLEKGEFQMTTAERKEKHDKRRLEIINYIHKYYTDPRTKTPHPAQRIELALDQIKVRIDPDVPAERQAQDIIKKLVAVIPLKRSEVQGTLKVPHAYLGQASGIIRKWCTVGRENYDSHGAVMQVSLVPGDYDAFIMDLNAVTKGDYDFAISGASAASGATDVSDDSAAAAATARKKGAAAKRGGGGGGRKAKGL